MPDLGYTGGLVRATCRRVAAFAKASARQDRPARRKLGSNSPDRRPALRECTRHSRTKRGGMTSDPAVAGQAYQQRSVIYQQKPVEFFLQGLRRRAFEDEDENEDEVLTMRPTTIKSHDIPSNPRVFEPKKSNHGGTEWRPGAGRWPWGNQSKSNQIKPLFL